AKLLAGQNPGVPPLDMKGALLRLVADLLPALPTSTNLNAILAANTLGARMKMPSTPALITFWKSTGSSTV
ncbi:hypothetical protein, partial [Klebsiella quasipneumoniae]|uniref:hypothetical protein n=1 Tax=Klebsiella quasipneumoniae TaxID=1463165 RepID=UPI0027321405